MLIDVIVPVYNAAAYIEKFFDLVEPQADREVRFLFVDDGSKDTSLQILQDCAAKATFPTEILHQENTGVSGARNLGIEHATASYITFFDIDDVMSTDYVSVLKKTALQNDFEVFVFASKRVHAEHIELEKPKATTDYQQLTATEELQRFLADPTRLGVVNLLIQRDYISRVQTRFAVGYKYYEDYDFIYRIFSDATSILVTSTVLYYYVQREGSAMSRFTADRITCLQLMKNLEPWLKERVPEFFPTFQQWGCARLYWSVLWQAALGFQNFKDFKAFADRTEAKTLLKKLKGFPDTVLQASTRLYLCSPWLYWLAVRMVGRKKSEVASANLEEILQQIDAAKNLEK